jgi:hypothetical protein
MHVRYKLEIYSCYHTVEKNTFPVRMTIYISQILRIYLAVLNYLLARWRLGIVLDLPGLNLVHSGNGMFRITVTLPYLTTLPRL